MAKQIRNRFIAHGGCRFEGDQLRLEHYVNIDEGEFGGWVAGAISMPLVGSFSLNGRPTAPLMLVSKFGYDGLSQILSLTKKLGKAG